MIKIYHVTKMIEITYVFYIISIIILTRNYDRPVYYIIYKMIFVNDRIIIIFIDIIILYNMK